MTVLVDTCVFFAFYSLRDRYHMDAVALLIHAVEGVWGRVYVSDYVLDETLTLLKYRLGGDTARAFYDSFVRSGIVRVIYSDEDVISDALELFFRNVGRRGFSFTDAVIVSVLRRYGIDLLLTFDLRSFSGLVKGIIGPGYWDSLSSGERERIRGLLEGFL